MPQRFPCFGLTGGVASGKTTVARFFAERGAKVIDADSIGHELLRPPNPERDHVMRQFGKQILNARGEIDRAKLGEIVFADPGRRRELEAILHPRIVERQEEAAEQYFRENAQAVILVEAALIFEAGVAPRFRKVVVTWCTPQQQLERLVAKAGISRSAAEARIASQMPAEEKRCRADYVIDCSGNLEETRHRANAVYSELKRIVVESREEDGLSP
jgi:dephospho-CoA kinase